MKYTRSAILDTIFFVKTIIYIVDLCIQIGYVTYLSIRIATDTGIFVTNLILLIISSLYLLFHLVTTKEFYTRDEKILRSKTRKAFKITKRIVNSMVVFISVYNLIISKETDNAQLLTTLFMLGGFVTNITNDIILKLINDKIMLIFSAFKYDCDNLREEHFLVTDGVNLVTKVFRFDVRSIPLQVDPKMLERIKRINHRQEMKDRRRKDFRSGIKEKE